LRSGNRGSSATREVRSGAVARRFEEGGGLARWRIVDVGHWLLGGFAGTIVLTTLLAGSQGVGLTRINIPYLLGTMLTSSRDRARAIGFGLHFVMGWAIAALYVPLFEAWGGATPLKGMALGAMHAAFLLLPVMSVLPALHPRMVSEEHGPTAERQLEPPGFLALHYGFTTPLSVLIAHIVYGGLLGFFFRG
jgi:hypothetical protein